MPITRSVCISLGFAGCAACLCAIVLGFGPAVSGPAALLLLLAVVPFVLGALTGRAWVAPAVFVLVAATALLPDRTVVESSGNTTTFTTYATSLSFTLLLGAASAAAAFGGFAFRQPGQAGTNPILLRAVDTWLGRGSLVALASILGGLPLVAAVVTGLLLRASHYAPLGHSSSG